MDMKDKNSDDVADAIASVFLILCSVAALVYWLTYI